MIPIEKREPHDGLTPEDVIDFAIQDWDIRSLRGESIGKLAEHIIDALVYKAYFEGAESALRWLDPGDNGTYILDRIGIRRD